MGTLRVPWSFENPKLYVGECRTWHLHQLIGATIGLHLPY
jgi:hypothetical protein